MSDDIYTLNDGTVIDLASDQGLHRLRMVIARRLGMSVQRGLQGDPSYLWYSPHDGGTGVTLDVILPLPNWPKSADDALQLEFDEVEVLEGRQYNGEKYFNFIVSRLPENPDPIQIAASTYPIARCLAWLEYQEHKRGGR